MRSELSPLDFLFRSADVWATRPALVDGGLTRTYAELLERAEAASGALAAADVRPGDRVALLLQNTAEMLELHFAVPGAGAVLVPLNTRLAAPEYARLLRHSGAKVMVADTEFREVLAAAVAELGEEAPQVFWVGEGLLESGWEAALAVADPRSLRSPASEDDLLSINYTSGTTGDPKGVMTNHRGAYLHSLGVIAESGLGPRSAYLWTLPMFHCNGWAYTWAVTAAGAVHVCERRADPEAIWDAIEARGVTHMCAAPTVIVGMLGSERASRCVEPVRLFVGGSPPTPATLERAAELNVRVTHLYGLTETYGPIAVCAWNPDWDALTKTEQARLRARQGVATIVSQRLRVVDDQLRDVPRDGQTLGEVVMRGNNVMVGYFENAAATREAFRGGWFHSGDLGVMHPDGYVELRDRLKDVIISGGENVSTVEVEQALAAFPGIAEAAVVAMPHERWGEVPCAFVRLWGGERLDRDEVSAFLRSRLAGFKVPKRIEVVAEMPKTATGKVQKFQLRELAAKLPDEASR